MNDLNNIVSSFTKDEENRFITFLERKNKRNDTKNVQLFKLLAKNELSSKDVCLKLYKDNKKDAYHALRKRLYQSIIDFIANTNLEEENSIDMQIIKYILASKTFLLNKQYKVAYKVLDKAELIAQDHYLFPLLNEIYHTKIQYAYTNPSINFSELISKFKVNQKNNYLEDELNIVYVKIRQTLNDITYKGEIIDFKTLLNNTLKEHDISINESMSFKSLYQLMTIVSISAFITKDYLKTESFLIETYKSLQTYKSKEKQLYYHIQVLYIIANTLFRNKKFKESLSYLNQMHFHMQLNQKKHYHNFKLKYNLLLALNYNYSGKQEKSIHLLESFIIKKHPDFESLLDIYLSLIMCYFQKEEYKKAQSLFSQFYHTDKWYEEKAGIEWVIKKNLIEILLHIELQNTDLVDSKLLSFKRSHSVYLKSINQQRVLNYLTLVEYYYKNPEEITTSTFYNKVEASFEWLNIKYEDIFVMSFYAWLKSKMNKEPLYKTTLSLIKKS